VLALCHWLGLLVRYVSGHTVAHMLGSRWWCLTLILRSQCRSTRATASSLAPLADRGHRRALQPRTRRSPGPSGVDLGVVWI